MLDEFIEVNKLDAEIIFFSKEPAEGEAERHEKLANSTRITVRLFVTPERDTFLAVFPSDKHLSEEKLKELSGEENLAEAEAKETEEWIGYKKGLLPPISIYGIKVFIDTALKDSKSMFCKVGPRDFLRLSFDAILEANDAVVVRKITK
jgi:prolyl-tRNA editing enzyme YbaK/EbsC (Cys-tRNA(Pro) deacylase)